MKRPKKPLVRLDWIDPCHHTAPDSKALGLETWSTTGYLITTKRKSHGIPCTVVAQSWNENDGYVDVLVIPTFLVQRITKTPTESGDGTDSTV